jgi:hypothetical protein
MAKEETGKKVVKRLNKEAVKGMKAELKKPNTTGKPSANYAEYSKRLKEFGTAKDKAKVNKAANKKPARMQALSRIRGFAGLGALRMGGGGVPRVR